MHPEPPSLEIQIEEHKGSTVLIITGQIDLYSDQRLGAELKRLFEEGQRQLVLDLESVPFVDSAGFGLFIAMQKQYQQVGGRIHYANVPRNVESVVKLSRLQNFIRIFGTRAEALGAFSAADD